MNEKINVNETIDAILEKPFEEFREENSNGTKSVMYMFNTDSDCYVKCPERDYHSVFGKLPVGGGIHVAISGSVNPSFGQISEIKPDLSILIDINKSSIDYLRFRLALLDASSKGADYWNRLIGLLVPFSELNEDKIMKACENELPSYLVPSVFAVLNSAKIVEEARINNMTPRFISFKNQKGIEKIIKKEISNRPDYVADYKSSNSERYEHDQKCIRYELSDFIQHIQQSDLVQQCGQLYSSPINLGSKWLLRTEFEKDLIRGWSSVGRYDVVKKAWNNGKIKGIVDDFTGSGFETAIDISLKSKKLITLVYLSNIRNYWSTEQRKSLLNLIDLGLSKGVFHPECRVIDWDLAGTKVYSIEDYVASGRHNQTQKTPAVFDAP